MATAKGDDPRTRSRHAQLLPTQISMDDADVDPVGTHPRRQLLGNGDATVLTAGATNRHRRIVLALAQIALLVAPEQLRVAVDESCRTFLTEHVVAHLRVEPVER